jgi:hypothetical protein
MVEELFVACAFGDPALVLVQADREDWPASNASRVDILGGGICIVPSTGLFRIDKA